MSLSDSDVTVSNRRMKSDWEDLSFQHHYIYSFSNSFPFSYCRMLSRVPCALQQVLVGYLFYIQQCAHVPLLEAVSQGTRKQFRLQHGPVLIWKPFPDWNLPPDVQLKQRTDPFGQSSSQLPEATKGTATFLLKLMFFTKNS